MLLITWSSAVYSAFSVSWGSFRRREQSSSITLWLRVPEQGWQRQNVNLEVALGSRAGNEQRPVCSEGWDRRFYLYFKESVALFRVWEGIAECDIPFFKGLFRNSAGGALCWSRCVCSTWYRWMLQKTKEIEMIYWVHPMAPMHDLHMKKRWSLRAQESSQITR